VTIIFLPPNEIVWQQQTEVEAEYWSETLCWKWHGVSQVSRNYMSETAQGQSKPRRTHWNQQYCIMDPGHHVTLELLELGNYTSSLLYLGCRVLSCSPPCCW